MTKLIINCETGETEERELNAKEIAQQEIDEANIAALKAEAETKAAQRQTIADRLGLTADDLRALGL